MTKKTPNPIDVFVGSRVRLRRLMVGMSQEALADRLGVTFQQVQKYEKGTNRISASRLQAISDVFRVPPSFFFQDEDSAAPTAGVAHETGDVSTFVSSKEGLDLNRAFLKIEDAGVRKSIIALATALSKASAAAEAGERADTAPELRI
ncbi:MULTISPECIES: helix-turn-helix domain-containing protein [Shinella]|jgi:transcriptional regulator with XRE-family HTH domain|uniref:Transcriptional regulator with XRE-family HTH domain n=1 Tax=Shinella granuli TaxID=323621 RepID=A0A4R2D0L0_SHIGR|nr:MULTISPECIES: helix-turn-helix domain-containing protein [Shinella]ANH05415.1 transcriptional regulator [Shinella sp. HZN7]TCN47136.1 transcriptional regulator with XRE-family HTH domain [Shinella granuli]